MVAAHIPDDVPSGGGERPIEPGERRGAAAWVIEAMPAGMIDSPLDFIFAEHHRQREAAAILVMMADGEFDEAGARALVEFLTGDFALHIGDEELALFPMLREYCLPEDKVDRILERLEDEHREDEHGLDDVLGVIRDRIEGRPFGGNAKRTLRRFAEHISQHLALENGVLLPIARVRLGPREQAILAQTFRERRL